MAEFGIVMKLNGIDGNCKIPGYEKAILVENVNFGSSSHRSGPGITRTAVAQQTPIGLTIGAGSWLVELTQACFVNHNLGEVVINQIAMAENKDGKPRVIQTLTLQETVCTSVEQDWDGWGGPRMARITLEFQKLILGIRTADGKEKTADFTMRNFTESK